MTDKIRYFITRGHADRPRYYWYPAAFMRKLGWKPIRLDDDLGNAKAEALKQNIIYDKWVKDCNAGGPNGFDAPPAASMTLKSLCEAYITSNDFKKLAIKTQKYYQGGMRGFEEKHQDKLCNTITAAMVQDIFKLHSDNKPGKAAQLVRTGQAAFAWGIRGGFPGLPEVVQMSPWNRHKIRGARHVANIWTPEQIDDFVSAADNVKIKGVLMPSIGTAILIMEWIGHNPNDIIKLTHNAFKDGHFDFKRSKTAVAAWAEASPRVIQRLQDERTRQSIAGTLSTTLLIAEHTGRAWQPDNFRLHFRRIRFAAGLSKDLNMGHLRHTAITRFFDAGAQAMEIAGVTGHSLGTVETILDSYNTRTKQQSTRATTKRLHADKRHSKKD